MNNFDLVKLALDFIDENLAENVTFDTLASRFNYSSFHFHRIFSTVVGRSITEHIRLRRLAYAANKLCETKEPVTSVCYSCGFESIQTFCRVFKNIYGMTPGMYRKCGNYIELEDSSSIVGRYLKKINSKLKGENYMTPKFVHKEAFKIVGIEKYTGDGFEVIGMAWGEFKSRYTEIKNTVSPEIAYGYEDYSKDFTTEPMRFYYMAGVEVSSLDNIPAGMTGKSIPASDYAVFTVKGKNENGEIGKAFRYIYDTWLPSSEYVYSADICGDFEYYDIRWNCQSQDSEMDIYVPVSKKGL